MLHKMIWITGKLNKMPKAEKGHYVLKPELNHSTVSGKDLYIKVLNKNVDA